MVLSTRDRNLVGAVLVLAIIAIVLQFSGNLFPFPGNPPNDNDEIDDTDDIEDTFEAVELTLLENAGVMIEAGEIRVYIDPVDLPSEYGDSPADAILITHNHGDHYQESTVSMLQKEGTLNVFPGIMEDEIDRHDGTGVVPGDEVTVGSITVTAFSMYTFDVAGGAATHPAESEYAGYIVDVGGFTIFHAGDSKNIPEYEEIAGTIDVAMLPLGPGCQTMAEDEVVDAIMAIEPGYFVPIHFVEGDNDQFCSRFRSQIESSTECEVLNLDHYTSHTFETT
jgi:L-ascorbate metabolism protein UlaG (beta-lactamase superfamily)